MADSKLRELTWDFAHTGLTLHELLTPALHRGGDRIAVTCLGRDFTFRELGDRASRIAGALYRMGIREDDPVAVALPNSVEYVVADLAVVRLGAVLVPINEMLSESERAYILNDSAAKVVISSLEHLASLRSLSERTSQHLICVGPQFDEERIMSWDEALLSDPLPADAAHPQADHRGLILYTGGTTGTPKGVVHTQRGLALNLLAQVIENGVDFDDVLLLTSPLPHSAGFFLHAALLRGARCVLGDVFSPQLVVDRVQNDGVTFLFLVPTMIYRLLDYVESHRVALTGLRTVFYGAAPIVEDRLTQGLRLLGPVFEQLYGQSEAPNFLTKLPRGAHVPGARELQSCGQPVAMAAVRIVDEDGSEVPTGHVGEVVARAPYVMSGYHNRPHETAEALRGGWLHTGDLGHADERGYIYLVDRKKDMIISGGFNVYSVEVEQGLSRMPGIASIAVVGIPHADWGEAVVAYVVCADPQLDEAAILQFSRESMTSYKRPKRVFLLDTLPTTAVGKVDKKALRSSFPGW